MTCILIFVPCRVCVIFILFWSYIFRPITQIRTQQALRQPPVALSHLNEKETRRLTHVIACSRPFSPLPHAKTTTHTPTCMSTVRPPTDGLYLASKNNKKRGDGPTWQGKAELISGEQLGLSSTIRGLPKGRKAGELPKEKTKKPIHPVPLYSRRKTRQLLLFQRTDCFV